MITPEWGNFALALTVIVMGALSFYVASTVKESAQKTESSLMQFKLELEKRLGQSQADRATDKAQIEEIRSDVSELKANYNVLGEHVNQIRGELSRLRYEN